MRRAARVDASQEQIVKALRLVGASVYLIGLPVDAVVGFRGQNWLMEFKTAGTRYGKKPNDNQRDFMATWNGSVVMVDSADAALKAIGVWKHDA